MMRRFDHGRDGLVPAWPPGGLIVGHVELPPQTSAEHIMAMPVQAGARKRWTLEEFLVAREHAPGGERWELVDGELLVTPSPAGLHQRAIILLMMELYPYVKSQRIGEAVLAPRDVGARPGSITQPDVLVVPPAEIPRFLGPKPIERLILAVEVISPSSAFGDRNRKRPHYQQAGVPEYWIVDTDARLVERWRPADRRPEVLVELLEWEPAEAREPFHLDLRMYFDELFLGAGDA